MTFPTTPTVGNGRLLTGVQANTTQVRSFPALTGLTKNSGDLLVAIVIGYQSAPVTNAAFAAWTAGWTECHDTASATTLAVGMAYKWSTGSETAVQCTQVATVTGHACFIVLSIAGAHATTPPEAPSNMRANGTTGVANTGPMTIAGWGAEDTLWMAIAGNGEDATTGSFTGITAGPINYTDFVATALSGDVVGGVMGGIAFNPINAATNDPNTFTVDTSNARNCAVMLTVRPAPAGATDWPGTISSSWGNWTATGVAVTDRVATITTSWGNWTATGAAVVSHPATITTSWGNWTATATGTVTAPAPNWPGTIASVWPLGRARAFDTRSPSNNVSGIVDPIVLGNKLTFTVATTITHLWHYRSASSTQSAHTLKLWRSGGTLAGTVATSGESGSGWVGVALSTPVDVAAGEAMVVSVDYPAGDAYMYRLSGLYTSDEPDSTFNQSYYSLTLGTFPNVDNGVVNMFSDVTYASGGWTATGAAVVDHPATIASSWGTWTATGTAVVSHPATITTSWGNWTATGTAVVNHIATITTSWGNWTATGIAVTNRVATISTTWGNWTATGLAVVAHPATISTTWGNWTATGVAVVAHPATITTTWGTWTATGVGTVTPGGGGVIGLWNGLDVLAMQFNGADVSDWIMG